MQRRKRTRSNLKLRLAYRGGAASLLLLRGLLLVFAPAVWLAATPAAAWAAAGGAGGGDQAQGSVISGVVRDANGVVQMGALVQVLAQGSRTVGTAFTDMHGRYVVRHLAAGRYLVRASAALFVPASRGNLELSRGASSVVDLTLTALFDPASWLPAERRRADEAADDWKWTLRSSASRPILRVVAQDADPAAAEAGSGPASVTHGRESLSAGDGGFCQGGLRDAVELRREGAFTAATLQARLDADQNGAIGQGGSGSAEVAAGFERRDRFGGASRTVVSYQTHPQMLASGAAAMTQPGIEVFAITSAERLSVGEDLEIEAGARAEAVRTTVYALATYPFVHVTAHPTGTWRLEYRLASDRMVQDLADVSAESDSAGAEIPTAVVREGRLALETGRHQQLSATHKTGRASLAIAVYHDAMQSTSVAGGGAARAEVSAAAAAGTAAPQMLVDPATGQFRTLVGGYTTTGARVSFSAPVRYGVWIAAEYSTGAAMTAQAGAAASYAQAVNALAARNAQAAAVAVEGRVVGSGTRVRASYRWQTDQTVTAVDPYSDMAAQGFLGLLVQEPIRVGTLLPRGLCASVDVTNLLAQGYRPFLSADGQTLYFAQTPRTVQAGLSFTF